MIDAKFDRYRVSETEKRKAKFSFSLFGAIAGLSIILSVVFGVLIPRKHSIKTLGPEKEPEISLVESGDGNTYYVSSDNYLAHYDTFTDKELAFYRPVAMIRDLLERKGDLETLLPNSLEKFNYQSFHDVEDHDFVAAIDINGNFFKFEYVGDELTLTEDYHLVDSKLEFKMTQSQGDDAFRISVDQNNNFIMEEFSLLDLAAGPKRTRRLWEFDSASSSFGGKPIKGLAQGTGIWNIIIDDDAIYVLEEGGIIRFSRNFMDYDKDGEAINFHDEIDKNYIAYLREYLTDLSAEKKEALGLTDEIIQTAKLKDLENYYRTASKKGTGEAKYEAGLRLSSLPWCVSYDGLKDLLVVDSAYIDQDTYRVVYAGDFNIGGAVYSTKTESFYFANLLDNRIYALKRSAFLDPANRAMTFSSASTWVDSIDFGKRKLSTDYLCIRPNRFADSMYVLYANSRVISIVTFGEEVKMWKTFTADFNVFIFAGDANNERIQTLRQVRETKRDGSVITTRSIDSFSPARFAAKPVYVGFFVAFLILSAIGILLFVLSFRAYRSKKAMFKAKTIVKDVKKNKWTYIALIPFIGMLILFCYYEAFGSIAMSFFDYTADRPAYVWNNFGNYIRVFTRGDFWLSVGNMLFFLVADLILCIVPPLIFAFCLTIIRNKKYSGFIRAVMFIPAIIPGIASMLIWRIGIFGDYGVLNSIVQAFGGQKVQFLANSQISRWSLLLMGFPFVGGYLIFYGGLMNIPHDYYEAAELEGLGTFGRFLRIDIPLIMPQIKYIFVMTFIASVQNYARTFMLKSAGTITPVENMYVAMKIQGDYGLASAYATLIFLFLLAAVTVNFRMQKNQVMGDQL